MSLDQTFKTGPKPFSSCLLISPSPRSPSYKIPLAPVTRISIYKDQINPVLNSSFARIVEMGINSDLFVSKLPEYLICQSTSIFKLDPIQIKLGQADSIPFFRPVCMNSLSSAHSYCSKEHQSCCRCLNDLEARAQKNSQPLRCPQCRESANPRPSIAIARIVGGLQ